MIDIIYGLKGSGKTQRIVDSANARALKSNGCVVYITDQPTHSPYVDNKIRFVDIGKYNVTTESTLLAFVEGLLAGNYDITDIYIDGPAKFIKKPVEEMSDFYTAIELLSADHSVNFTVTVTAEEVPEYMKKYM